MRRLIIRFVAAIVVLNLVLLAVAAVLKRVIPSRGDELSDELALTAILDGVELDSRAVAFRGGSAMACLGGIELDLTGATIAGGGVADLRILAILGGIEITVPADWRVETAGTSLLGGVVNATREASEAAPLLRIDATTVLGGVSITQAPSANGDRRA